MVLEKEMADTLCMERGGTPLTRGVAPSSALGLRLSQIDLSWARDAERDLNWRDWYAGVGRKTKRAVETGAHQLMRENGTACDKYKGRDGGSECYYSDLKTAHAVIEEAASTLGVMGTLNYRMFQD